MFFVKLVVARVIQKTALERAPFFVYIRFNYLISQVSFVFKSSVKV